MASQNFRFLSRVGKCWEPLHYVEFWTLRASYAGFHFLLLRKCIISLTVFIRTVTHRVHLALAASFLIFRRGNGNSSHTTHRRRTFRLFHVAFNQGCGVGGKISDSDLSKISDSDSSTWREWNLTVKINGNRGAQQEISVSTKVSYIGIPNSGVCCKMIKLDIRSRTKKSDSDCTQKPSTPQPCF